MAVEQRWYCVMSLADLGSLTRRALRAASVLLPPFALAACGLATSNDGPSWSLLSKKQATTDSFVQRTPTAPPATRGAPSGKPGGSR
jgi:hypothetical protein